MSTPRFLVKIVKALKWQVILTTQNWNSSELASQSLMIFSAPVFSSGAHSQWTCTWPLFKANARSWQSFCPQHCASGNLRMVWQELVHPGMEEESLPRDFKIAKLTSKVEPFKLGAPDFSSHRGFREARKIYGASVRSLCHDLRHIYLSSSSYVWFGGPFWEGISIYSWTKDSASNKWSLGNNQGCPCSLHYLAVQVCS